MHMIRAAKKLEADETTHADAINNI